MASEGDRAVYVPHPKRVGAGRLWSGSTFLARYSSNTSMAASADTALGSQIR